MSSITLLIHIRAAALRGLGVIFWFITLPFDRFREECVQRCCPGSGSKQCQRETTDNARITCVLEQEQEEGEEV